MRLSDFDALSFDCYGTLIDWESGLRAALRPWADACGLPLDDEALLAAFARHEQRAEHAAPSAPYPDILRRTLAGIGQEVGAPVSPRDADRLATSVPDWPAFADSHDALVSLGRHYRLIILSNVDGESFAGSNRRLGVSFDRILTAQDIGSYKPDPRNFEALLAESERMGIASGRLLHVAQSLFHDHVPAKAAGLPTVWINRRGARPGTGATPQPSTTVTPDWEFDSMAAFAAAVEAQS